MKAEIFSHEMCIGTAELHVGDESMGGLYGDFIPTENYYQYVQKNVWEFWSTRKPDYNKWYSLKFNVQLANGYFLYAAGGFTFDDVEEFKDEPKRIYIAGVDRHVIEDFFLEPEPRPFVEEPWESISIEQKIAFEYELKKELGIYDKKSFLEYFRENKNEHILADFEVSALCHDQRNDDVLFRTENRNFNKNLAVVHLTWRGSKEAEDYPHVQFYENFDEFKYDRMYPDKAEWEY